MNTIIDLLRNHPQITDWKINIHRKESYELFFVKEKLETLRRTDTCDKLVTVYVCHGEFLGDSQFYVFPSTTREELKTLIDEAAAKALLINNPPYTLPAEETGTFFVESNFESVPPEELAAGITNAIFDAKTGSAGTLNSVEIFVNRHTETVLNSRGIHKTQTRYDAMVETIPTVTTDHQSVELYHQYNFSDFKPETIAKEISAKMEEVAARSKAVTPEKSLNCPVIFNIQELSELFNIISWDLEYSSVYSHSNQYSRGNTLQKDIQGDPISITMTGAVQGSVRSASFDSDGLSLTPVRLIENGVVTGYHGTTRYGQYLGEAPTGRLRCICLDAGTAEEEVLNPENSLEIVSMSGLQVELSSDYIGGEIRLAYLMKNGEKIPVTGISISGSLSQVLSNVRLSKTKGIAGGYYGPEKAITDKLKVY